MHIRSNVPNSAFMQPTEASTPTVSQPPVDCVPAKIRGRAQDFKSFFAHAAVDACRPLHEGTASSRSYATKAYDASRGAAREAWGAIAQAPNGGLDAPQDVREKLHHAATAGLHALWLGLQAPGWALLSGYTLGAVLITLPLSSGLAVVKGATEERAASQTSSTSNALDRP